MEYLNAIDDSLKKTNDNNIKYLNIFRHPSLVYGNTDNGDKLNFCKYSYEVQKEFKEVYPSLNYDMQYQKTSSCGCRIRFKTDSRKLIFRIKLKRGYNYKDIVMWNSSALTIYLVDEEGNYKFHKLITPLAGKQCFAKAIYLPPNSSVCIFLPNFDTVEGMMIGFQMQAHIKKFPYPKSNRVPILFYGGSISQGASATKSANSYPNIVSKLLNHDIINLSLKKCCKATPATADMIGHIKCNSIVIDYSLDAANKKEFEERYEYFYRKIREYHPDIKIILLTVASYNNSKKYDGFDEIIMKTYENAVSRGEKTYLLNQRELFDENDYDLISLNNEGYTDLAMLTVAEKICEILKS